MKLKRHFNGKFQFDILFIIVLWVIIHVAGWYSNGFNDFLSAKLILTTIGVTLLLGLLLSSSGNNKTEIPVGLPLINSYSKSAKEIKISPGGLNFLIRILYFILAIILIGYSIKIESINAISGLDIFYGFFLITGIVFYVIKFINNRNDFLHIDENAISWYDNINKNKFKITFQNITSFQVQNEKYKSFDYPKLLKLQTNDKIYTIDLKEMSMLQFSNEIIYYIKQNIDTLKSIEE